MGPDKQDIAKQRRVGTLACLTTLMLWTLGPNFITYLSDYLDSWTQNCLRYSVAFLVCAPLFYQSAKRGAITRDVCKRALLPAAANITMQSLWAAMFYHLNPALGVLLTKTNVLWVAAFSMLLIPAERVLLRSPRFWLGFGLSVTGLIGVVSLKETFTVSASGRGIAMAMGTAFFWSVYTLSVKIRLPHVDSKTSFSVISLFTAIGLWIVAACFGDIGDCLSLQPRTWLILIISAMLPIVLGHTCYYAAIKRIGPTLPALIILVQPALVLCISHRLFGEQIVPGQAIFGVILLIGACLAIWAQKDLRE